MRRVATITARQARFVNLDGKVQVNKVNSVEWASADYQITLDKGDMIQTGPEGVARIAFADGTTYTVKGDTLVTVEENIVERITPRRSAYTSAPAKWISLPAHGKYRARKRKFPSKMPWRLFVRTAARL